MKGIKGMKNNRFLDLLTSVDVLNTLNGGISEPRLSYHRHEHAREIRLYIPGITIDEVRVEVHNNTLSIFYFIPVMANGELIQMPQLVYSKVIPYYIDISKISSRGEANEPVVMLPYNKLAKGYHREIKLDEE